MARQGISQRDLARILGCTEANVGQMLAEHRTHGMRLRTAERLAEALGCGVVPVLTIQPGAAAVIAEWQEEARRKGNSLWEWLTTAVENSRRCDTVRFWIGQGLPTRVANALANAGIRSWRQLETLDRKDLLVLRDLGKMGVRDIEERLSRRRGPRAEKADPASQRSSTS